MEIFYIWTDHEYSMNFKPKTFCTFVLITFGLFSIVEINLYQISYATICFDCPDANFHLDEAKKSIDNGDYNGAKNHIDQAKQLIGQHDSPNQTDSLKTTNNTNAAVE